MATEQFKSKIAIKDFRHPDLMAKVDADGVFLGTIIGVAQDTTERTDAKTGEVSEGLRGTFKAVFPPEINKPVLRSSVLWLPDAVHTLISDQLKATDDDGLRINAHVEFGFQIRAQEAKNPAGYEWSFSSLIEPSGADPVDALEQRLLSGKDQKQLAAPESAKGKGRGKATAEAAE